MKLPTTSPATWVKNMKENLVFSSENHWHSGQSHKKNNRTIREIKRGHKSLKGNLFNDFELSHAYLYSQFYSNFECNTERGSIE